MCRHAALTPPPPSSQSASSSLSSLHAARQQLKEEGSELIDFFCEDRETFKLDDCFSIFSRFCCRFTAAAKVNNNNSHTNNILTHHN